MKKVLLITICLLTINSIAQQWQKAFLNEDMSVGAENIMPPSNGNICKTTINQLAGFPIVVPTNPNFKNMRNLTLADMNSDGIDDIIFATDNKLYVYTYQGLLWSKTLTGTAIYPPSVGDINGDGQADIVQVTGGVPANGRIHVFDKLGNLHTGWPVNFSNNWILCAPTLADLDNDGKMEIIVNERVNPAGNVHILKYDGSSFNSNWPVIIDGIPAVTPSVADVDNDGELDIIVCSTKSRYIFGLDGQPKAGFPLTTAPAQSYSYQSPIVVDYDNDNMPEIVGATHGDLPKFYVMKNDNSPYQSWPTSVPDNSWTYSTPTVVKINGDWNIFMSRPISSDTLDMLYGWDKNGNMLPNFPIVKSGGLEGYISVADITDDSDFELIFGSNLKDNNGNGFIHAYKMDGSGEINGFPLRPIGFTFMNGVCIRDVDGNGKTNLVALSYSLNFNAEPDSVYVNVYDLDINYSKSKVLWGTYKGSNTRTGNYDETINTVSESKKYNFGFDVFPNPVNNVLNLKLNGEPSEFVNIKIIDVMGRIVLTENVNLLTNESIVKIDVSKLKKGFYSIAAYNKQKYIGSTNFICY